LLINSNIGALTQKLARVDAKKVYLAGEISTKTSDILSDERGILLRSMLHDKAKADSYYQAYKESADAFHKAIDELTPLLVTEEGRRITADLRSTSEKSDGLMANLYQLASEEKFDEARAVADQLATELTAATTGAARLKQMEKEQLAKSDAEVESTAALAIWATVFLMLVCAAISGISVVVVRGANAELRQSVEALSAASEQVASASSQVASSSQSLAQGASEQAASLEETSSSATQITAMTSQNAEHSKNSALLTVEMSDEVSIGNRKLTEMTESMHQISQSSDKVAKVIKLIDEIAFQTNILALNAAVEAARAGEAGMGFAVVADEVRSLAQRCAQAAKETAELIEESLHATEEGQRKLDEVAKAIAMVTEHTGTAKTLADEVSVGSSEQARGLEQISRAITQMEEVTHRTAACAEEGAAAGQELNSQSEALRSIAARLTLMVGGVRGSNRNESTYLN
jgi:methyl-accepting chemotaxis protein/methyl-accepting chemotaxis protein-1 (serine sensor receptor)